MSKTVLMPLPEYGFDPSESAIPWGRLTQAGHKVVFATPTGKPSNADIRMLTGKDLPVLWRQSLMATKQAINVYKQMSASESFQHPIAYEAIEPSSFDALLLPGGHDKGMRPYLESFILQQKVAWFFDNNRPIGAICHGTLLAARTTSNHPDRLGKSVLWGRKTTGLTRRQELIAAFLTPKLGDYYRTYPTPMADELITYLKSPDDYSRGPGYPIPLFRDTENNDCHGYTVKDKNYLSARWPGDANRFAKEFVLLIEQY